MQGLQRHHRSERWKRPGKWKITSGLAPIRYETWKIQFWFQDRACESIVNQEGGLPEKLFHARRNFSEGIKMVAVCYGSKCKTCWKFRENAMREEREGFFSILTKLITQDFLWVPFHVFQIMLSWGPFSSFLQKGTKLYDYGIIHFSIFGRSADELE